jgi:hypothetical protein
MTTHDAAAAMQPEPERQFSLLGSAKPARSDYARVWWLVPGAAGARAVLLPLVWITGVSMALSSLMGREALQVFLFIALVFALPYFVVWLLGQAFVRRRLERLGSAPVEYRIDQDGVELAHAGGKEHNAWSSLRAFVQTSEVFVLYPRQGSVIVLPQRAFTAGAEHLAWLLRSRLDERHLPRWGLRSALWAAGVMTFLSVWHFATIPTAEELAELRAKNAELSAKTQPSPPELLGAPHGAHAAGAAADARE